MWICTLQSLLLHIIKYSEYENKALKTLPNIYFLLTFLTPFRTENQRKNKKQTKTISDTNHVNREGIKMNHEALTCHY